jgi:hypothetical protein
MNTKKIEQEWHILYAALNKILASFGIENPYGKGDYWLVDDNYGDSSQKICISKLSFLRPAVLTAIQKVLQPFPDWRVLVQIDIPVGDVAASSSGITVYSNRIEQHWDQVTFAELAKSLGLKISLPSPHRVKE